MRFAKLLFLLLSVPVFGLSQNGYVFRHFTADDGLLPDPQVTVFQDPEGFYWFNSVSGIQRFDGKKFLTYKYNYTNEKDITEQFITKPLEDKEKNIWLLTKEGIYIFNRQQQKLSRLYLPDAADKNVNNTASVFEDKNNELWIFTQKNIFKYNYTLHKPVLFVQLLSNENKTIKKLSYDAQKNGVWLLLDNAANEAAFFNFNTKQLSSPFKNTVDELHGNTIPVSLFELDKSGDLWIADYLGYLCKINTVTGKTTHFSVLVKPSKQNKTKPAAYINCCLDDENGNIWFGGENYCGLLQYSKKDNRFSNVKNENNSDYRLDFNASIYNLFKDNEDNIWIDSDLGLNIFNARKQQFTYLDAPSNTTSEFFKDVTCIFQSSTSRIWVATWGNGIFEYDTDFKLLKNYVHDDDNQNSLGEPLNRTWALAEDRKGRIWVGSQYAMLSVLDTVTQQFTNRVITTFNKKTIMDIVADKKNNLWFGLYDGALAKCNAGENAITVYRNLYAGNTKKLSQIAGLAVDNNNKIWAATTENGLNRFNERTQTMDEGILFNRHTFSPCFLNDSAVIGGTSGNGFYIYNQYKKTVKFYTVNNGLSSNTVFGALPGKKNDVWIFTGTGIEQLNLATQKIASFNINDGIRDPIFSGAFCRLKSGIIMVAANSGILYFNPDSIRSKPAPANVLITGFSAAQQDLSVDSLLQKNKVQLAYNQNNITIEYASLSFAGRKTDQYFYKLEGIDKSWIAAGAQRSITYANLSPGSYIFEVKAQNFNGTETKKITQLIIIIQAPWWQTWWAYFLWFIIGSLLMYAIFIYRKRNRNALARIRKKIASDLHDDIGSTLNSISVYSEVASQQLVTNTENAKKILYKMGAASRNMIDTMNDIVWSINPKNDQFENILQRMQYFAGEILSGKNILLQFNAAENLKNIKLSMEKRKNFYLIFKEAVNNACKYSKAKMVSVSIAVKANRLVMIISDDGTGFEMTTVCNGNGLKNMQARAQEMQAQLNVKSWLHKGTRIELNLPLK